ncbi:hypothetical protein CLOP_g6723 [Closterium sp. NIES-67]|nr:hypothetical protein CLOP_g6723 [Closterium sp. NIES-67]
MAELGYEVYIEDGLEGYRKAATGSSEEMTERDGGRGESGDEAPLRNGEGTPVRGDYNGQLEQRLESVQRTVGTLLTCLKRVQHVLEAPEGEERTARKGAGEMRGEVMGEGERNTKRGGDGRGEVKLEWSMVDCVATMAAIEAQVAELRQAQRGRERAGGGRGGGLEGVQKEVRGSDGGAVQVAGETGEGNGGAESRGGAEGMPQGKEGGRTVRRAGEAGEAADAALAAGAGRTEEEEIEAVRRDKGALGRERSALQRENEVLREMLLLAFQGRGAAELSQLTRLLTRPDILSAAAAEAKAEQADTGTDTRTSASTHADMAATSPTDSTLTPSQTTATPTRSSSRPLPHFPSLIPHLQLRSFSFSRSSPHHSSRPTTHHSAHPPPTTTQASHPATTHHAAHQSSLNRSMSARPLATWLKWRDRDVVKRADGGVEQPELAASAAANGRGERGAADCSAAAHANAAADGGAAGVGVVPSRVACVPAADSCDRGERDTTGGTDTAAAATATGSAAAAAAAAAAAGTTATANAAAVIGGSTEAQQVASPTGSAMEPREADNWHCQHHSPSPLPAAGVGGDGDAAAIAAAAAAAAADGGGGVSGGGEVVGSTSARPDAAFPQPPEAVPPPREPEAVPPKQEPEAVPTAKDPEAQQGREAPPCESAQTAVEGACESSLTPKVADSVKGGGEGKDDTGKAVMDEGGAEARREGESGDRVKAEAGESKEAAGGHQHTDTHHSSPAHHSALPHSALPHFSDPHSWRPHSSHSHLPRPPLSSSFRLSSRSHRSDGDDADTACHISCFAGDGDADSAFPVSCFAGKGDADSAFPVNCFSGKCEADSTRHVSCFGGSRSISSCGSRHIQGSKPGGSFREIQSGTRILLRRTASERHSGPQSTSPHSISALSPSVPSGATSSSQPRRIVVRRFMRRSSSSSGGAGRRTGSSSGGGGGGGRSGSGNESGSVSSSNGPTRVEPRKGTELVPLELGKDVERMAQEHKPRMGVHMNGSTAAFPHGTPTASPAEPASAAATLSDSGQALAHDALASHHVASSAVDASPPSISQTTQEAAATRAGTGAAPAATRAGTGEAPAADHVASSAVHVSLSTFSQTISTGAAAAGGGGRGGEGAGAGAAARAPTPTPAAAAAAAGWGAAFLASATATRATASAAAASSTTFARLTPADSTRNNGHLPSQPAAASDGVDTGAAAAAAAGAGVDTGAGDIASTSTRRVYSLCQLASAK